MKLTADQKQQLREGKARLAHIEGELRFVAVRKAKRVRKGRTQETRARSSQGGVGWVYLMRCDGSDRCKIGRSVDVEDRLKRINDHGNSIPPYNIVLKWKRRVANDKAVEDALHRKYEEYRVRGEWFDLNPAIIDEIMALTSEKLNFLYCE